MLILALFVSMTTVAQTQRFFNLTVDDITIDSLLPEFTYSIPVGENYADSVYELEIRYPEFLDMTSSDIALYNKVSGAPLPELPVINQQMTVDRKSGSLELSLTPIVERGGKKRFLVSFMIAMTSKPVRRAVRRMNAKMAGSSSDRYVSQSKLASGTWAKIRVPADGIYQLTNSFIQSCGFSDPNKVKIYGFGGHLLNEKLTDADLRATDDVPEVPTCTINGKRLFYGRGPVSWESPTATVRTRNPYSDYGYYFLSDIEGEPLTIDSAEFVQTQYLIANDYHSLHEKDNFAWYQGGRKLFENDPIAVGDSRKYEFANTAHAASAYVTISVSAGSNSTYSVTVNGKPLQETRPSYSIRLGRHDWGNDYRATDKVANLLDTDTVTVTTLSGGPVRLDYISFTYDTPRPVPLLSRTNFASPEYVYRITNQNHHADANADLVIIIPTSQKLLAQAKRLAEFHETHDGMTVNIVPADELYNEFSSGTPDAGAYRHYLKMMYDRARTPEEMPKSLLLFGDCVWDNRMLTSETRNFSLDDYLLCYESENSFSQTNCYVNDGWLTLLDDGEGGTNSSIQASDKEDMGVGRFPVVQDGEAKIMADKVINYGTNKNAGDWQNTIMFLGDDGNDVNDGNIHMVDVNRAADQTNAAHPGFLIKKVMWDAYTREATSTGNTYPEVTALLKQQQAEGALIFDYAGHGSSQQLSHEGVLHISDFGSFTNTNLPLWVTASCDIMPFDGTEPTLGETAVLNSRGGAVAFYGTTRTVYAQDNTPLNIAFMKHVLRTIDGKPITLGEAQRLTKNEMIVTGQDRTQNKLQYSLLGDPAMSLILPSETVVVDSINGISVDAADLPVLKAGSVARITGRIVSGDEVDGTFTGLLSATVRDTKDQITCRNNNGVARSAFTYYDRTKTLFNGTDSVRNGRFTFTFAVPRDINYAEGTGLINFYAVNSDHRKIANGSTESFSVNSSEDVSNDSIGPSLYCYLNTPSFVNGGKVNSTPYFVAEITDKDGINASGSGIGHDLELMIDGDATKVYNLNGNFIYDFGSYTRGTTHYSIPELSEGPHTLRFRAWDILNNSSTATLSFTVVKGLQPEVSNVSVTNNPASTSTTFIVTHNYYGSNVDVIIDVFDMSGRLLWQHAESGVSSSNAYTVPWDLTLENGGRLQTGVYLYRVRLSSDGGGQVSKAKKLIVVDNN